jgi:hypothetical protein
VCTATNHKGMTMTITTSRRARHLAGGVVLSAAAALIAVGAPAVGHADPGPSAGPEMGCEVIHWGLFGADRRKICDGPKQSDGTWQRIRTVYNPSHNVPLSCLSDGDCFGGYTTSDILENQQSYPVAPDTVLPDEPGWLSPYTYNVL